MITSRRRVIEWLGASTLTCGLALPRRAAAQALPDLAGRLLRVVTENAYPPLNMLDPKTGKSQGWEIDAINELGRRLHFTPDWRLSSWDAMIQSVRDGQFDVGMDGIAITEARATQVAFSEPYLRAELFMLVRADETRFTDAASFLARNTLIVAAQPGTVGFDLSRKELLGDKDVARRLKLFETFGATLQGLRAGDADVVLSDATAARLYMKQFPGAFKLVGRALAGEAFGFIFKPGSPLVPAFNAGLRNMRSDGTLDRLTKKWFVDYGRTP